jgi:hypothetical protein
VTGPGHTAGVTRSTRSYGATSTTTSRCRIEDILVNGPPWNTRIALRAHVWAVDPDGGDAYGNRAVLMINARWGKIRRQEDYEDTERAAAFDAYMDSGGTTRSPR